MTGKEIYNIWAPKGATWVDWVRPVPFIPINNNFKVNTIIDFSIPTINYIDMLPKNSALIIDLPGCESIKEGIALAKLGFRPIPVFNGTIEQPNSLATCDNKSISLGLILGASELKNIDIPNDAPPAFLINTDRMNRLKYSVSTFDNSWDLYDQDIPSSQYFIEHGITNIVVHSNILQKDLKKIFAKLKKSGMKFYLTNGYDEPKEEKIIGVKYDKF